jgi:hypothetical protein
MTHKCAGHTSSAGPLSRDNTSFRQSLNLDTKSVATRSSCHRTIPLDPRVIVRRHRTRGLISSFILLFLHRHRHSVTVLNDEKNYTSTLYNIILILHTHTHTYSATILSTIVNKSGVRLQPCALYVCTYFFSFISPLAGPNLTSVYIRHARAASASTMHYYFPPNTHSPHSRTTSTIVLAPERFDRLITFGDWRRRGSCSCPRDWRKNGRQTIIL